MRQTRRYEMYVVTKKSSDYPDYEYVARYWWNNMATADAVLMKDDEALEKFRTNLRLQMWGRITHDDANYADSPDDPVVIETWMRVAR